MVMKKRMSTYWRNKMKFNCRNEKKFKALTEWHLWFAWYPVKAESEDGSICTVWLQYVQRSYRTYAEAYEADLRHYLRSRSGPQLIDFRYRTTEP